MTWADAGRLGARTGRRSAFAAAGLAIALGTPLVVIAAVGDQLEYPGLAAALRGAWIGLYALVGLFFVRRRLYGPLGLALASLALVTAIACLDALPGQLAYTASRVATLAVVPLAALVLVAIPEARIGSRRLVRLIILSVPLLLVLAIAYLMSEETAPWSQAASQCRTECAGSAIQVTDAPALARGLLALAVLVMVAGLLAVCVVMARAVRAATPVSARIVTPLAWITAVWAGPAAAGLIALAVAPEPDRLGPYLYVSAVLRAALPLAMLAVVIAQAVRTAAIRDELTALLREAGDPADVERAIAEVLDDPSARLAFRDGAGWIDVHGLPLDVDPAGEDRGWIAMSPDGGRADALTFDPGLHTQEERIQAIAALGAVALDRTRTEADLRAMRRRLVEVADHERRRIERNLHDGAQQRLIGMAARMAMARDTLATDQPELAIALLRDLGGDVQQALDELRRLAHGLYPPVLVDYGLGEALRSAARHSPAPVDLGLAEVGRLDPVEEAAVYFCGAEALQNAVKHAGPDVRITLRLWREDDGAVAFEVADEGRGFIVGPDQPGTGLMGMKDRMTAVGGTLTLESEPGRGTRVRGRLPADVSSAGRGMTEPAAAV